MGQHKYNPNCELAKKGELPPKPKKLSKRECEKLLMHQIEKVTGITELRKHIKDVYD